MCLQNTYKVVVVEDEQLLLNDLVSKIEKTDTALKVVGTALNGREALSVIVDMKPDILFTDVKMPVMDGLELITQARKICPNLQIIIVSGCCEFTYVQKALKLGVSDYHLKPVKIQSLVETINNVKRKLESIATISERNIIFSCLSGKPADRVLPYSMKKGCFILLLLSIGNISNNIIPPNYLSIINNLWSRLHWSSLLKPLLEEGEKWWIIDENQQSNKFLLISCNDDHCENILSSVHSLKDKLAKLVSPYPVNIFLTEKAIPYTEIWALSQELRYLLKQTLVVGHSRVVTPSRLAEINLLPPIWDSNTYRKINTIIKSGNPMLIKKELFYLFDRWGELGYPQVLLENALFKLAHLLQLDCLNNSAAELLLYKNAINEKLAMAPDFKNVYDDIWEVLISLYSFDQDKYDNSKERVDCVASYLKDNFAKPQSMEEISHRFNFNPSYLTRIFKKHKGNSPVQYLINLRIEEAKRLIRRNPDMDFKEIGEIVGYNDNYYFYRAFKTVSGLTLSDFKEEVLK